MATDEGQSVSREWPYEINAGRGPRCFCGHYASEHDGRCHGAYATLAADADDAESVEVHCHCDGFWVPDEHWLGHEVRRDA